MSAAIARRVSFGTAPKYKNKATILLVDGKREQFPSQKEATAYAGLRLREKAGRVRNVRRQVPYALLVGGKKVCKYIADFVFEEYEHGEWREIVADAKGYPTPVYRLKKKLMLACLGIEIREL